MATLPTRSGRSGRRVRTEQQFVKCKECGATLFVKELDKNLMVCSECGYHFRMTARRRMKMLLDPGSFKELFTEPESADPLGFKGRRSYLERIRESQKKTGLKEAVVCGTAEIDGHAVAIAVMDFHFMGGSMGSVVGEKVTRTIELGTRRQLPVVVVCCSGGARMDEGVLSLMQMAKTSAAVQRHREAGLFYFTVLTDPTMAGVSASFAFLGDVIVAEPGAMIGFAGARVIEQTMKVKLPKDFQSAAFQVEHGQVDVVVERENLRPTLIMLLSFAEAGEAGKGPRGKTPATRKAGAKKKAAKKKSAANKKKSAAGKSGKKPRKKKASVSGTAGAVS